MKNKYALVSELAKLVSKLIAYLATLAAALIAFVVHVLK